MKEMLHYIVFNFDRLSSKYFMNKQCFGEKEKFHYAIWLLVYIEWFLLSVLFRETYCLVR